MFISGYAGAAGLLVPASVAAQTAGGRAAGTIEQELRPPPTPRSETQPTLTVERPIASPTTSNVSFFVRDIVVEGVTVLDPKAVRQAVAPFTGRVASFADMSTAAAAVTALYGQAGYVLSFAVVPEQTIRDGVVKIVVVEGRIDQIEVEVRGSGALVSHERIASAIRRRLAGLANGEPVRAAELERAILGADDLAGIKPVVVLRPSKTQEGRTDLAVVVDADPFAARLSADNRLRPEFGREAGGATISLFSVLVPGDELRAQGRIGRHTRGLRYWSGRYEASVADSAARAYASYSQADTAAVRGLLGLLNFTGTEKVARFGARYPLQRSRSSNIFVQAEGAAIDTKSGIFGTTLIEDRLRTGEVDLIFDRATADGAKTVASFGLIQGIEGLGSTKFGNPLASRALGDPQFTALTASYYRNQPIGRMTVAVDLDGQSLIAGNALSSVECSYGGSRFGRAYESGIIGGDHCLRGSLELSRVFRPLDNVAIGPFAYADGIVVGQRNPLVPGEPSSASAASGGVGLRAWLPLGLSAEVVAAVPITARYAKNGHDPRVYFTLGLSL